jgi:hypothetical protein
VSNDPFASQSTQPLESAASLALRLSPVLVELGLARTISWQEASLVLDLLEDFELRGRIRWSVAHEMLGGEVSR